MRSSFDLVIRRGVLVLQDRLLRGSLGIINGKIAAIADGSVVLMGEDEIDARGRLVLPGMIDLHVHFRDPGLTYKEDFGTGSRAAAKGGVTTVGDMPNNLPPITSAARLREKQSNVATKAHVDYLLWASATSAADVSALAEAGAAGLKVFMAKPDKLPSGQWTGRESPFPPELFIDADDRLLDIFAAAAQEGLLVVVHLGNPELRHRHRSHWNNRPFASVIDELRDQPTLAVREAAMKCLLFAREVGTRLHFAHIPPAVVAIVREAKQAGDQVTAETLTPFISFDMVDQLGTLGFDRYRSAVEHGVLWNGIHDGTIDSIATDHAPHTREEKAAGIKDILSCPSGYPELDTVLPMLLDQVSHGKMTLLELTRLTAAAPAAIAGIAEKKGRIAVGLDADLVIADPNAEWVITAEGLETKCRWSPFEGRRVRGRVDTTMIRGRVVAADGIVVAQPGYGELLTPRLTATRGRDGDGASLAVEH